VTGALAKVLIYRSCLITYSIMSGTLASGTTGYLAGFGWLAPKHYWPGFTRSLCLFWIHRLGHLY
jgi:hypothetical protein